MTEKKVWIGFTHDVGDQGYQDPHTSEPTIAFDSLETARKWSKLGRNRKIKMLFINKNANCHECGHVL